MTNDSSFVWTLDFLVGTLIAGLLLNVVTGYVVRAADHVWMALPDFYKRTRKEEGQRIKRLASVATTDNTLYAVLSAEAGRLRVQQVLGFLVSFICFSILMLIVSVAQVETGSKITTTQRLQAVVLVLFLVPVGMFHYAAGRENAKRARRLDIALRAVHKHRELPVMD